MRKEAIKSKSGQTVHITRKLHVTHPGE